MAVKVLAPRMGEGVEELTVVKWLKAEGEAVKELEPLLEVETDKVVTEIPSPASGRLLKITVPENTPTHVGEVMAWIGASGEALAEAAPKPGAGKAAVPAEEKTEGDKQKAVEPVPGERSGFLSPIVRRMAAEHGLDLRRVRGSGQGGRVTKQDVLAYLENRSPVSGATVSSGALFRDTGSHDTFAHDTLLPLTAIRRQIAERMQLSKQTAPHVLTVMEADLSGVSAHRAANKAAFAAEGINLTYTAYFVAALAAALKAFPLANASWTEQGILIHGRINIGMATSLGEEGLIVPVIRDAQDLSLRGVSRAVNDLSERARSKKLRPEEVRDGTFTLTNHGTGGSLFAMPIINQPQVGILGTGAVHKRPVAVTDSAGNDAIAIRPMVYLSFVFDHRILDGASADRFLARVKETLEHWNG